MAMIPSMVLKRMYTIGSLHNVDDGVQFSIKNRLMDVSVLGIEKIKVDGKEIPSSRFMLRMGEKEIRPGDISADAPIDFPLRAVIDIVVNCDQLPEGKHPIEIQVQTKPYGKLKIKVDDVLSAAPAADGEANGNVADPTRIPRAEADFEPSIIKTRQKYIEDTTGVELKHLPHYSFDPTTLGGNIEHFSGVAQIPIGIAGPLRVNGEHAKGEFLIPLATTEGTLVASYNRGIKLMNKAGGVKATVSYDAMQRAPVFVFDDARGARDFVAWLNLNMGSIREEAETTSSIAILQYIDPYLSNKFAFLRFNFSTGDAAGQNMVGRATFAACQYILNRYDGPPIRHFYLESNFATDKKASQVNIMRTRGKRVTAEATIPRAILEDVMRVTPESLAYHSQVANVGAFLSGANNNGLHSANAITAMFIATGQDVANVAESSAGIIFAEVQPDGDLYISLTIPSLIVATYGGGTGLATQQECLRMLDCVGKGKVNKFAEIVASVVLAGELSLAAAISSSDWVSSHEQYGRNR